MDRLLSLRAFQAVGELSSFTAAGMRLSLDPSKVSRLVADLENHLKVQLLHRTTRHVSLTQSGVLYLEDLTRTLQELDAAESRVKRESGTLAGPLRILAEPNVAEMFLAPRLGTFMALHPGILPEISVGPVDYADIQNFDVTLMVATQDFDEEVVAFSILQSSGILVAAPGYLQSHGIPQSPYDLADHACLVRESRHLRPTLLRLYDEADNIAEVKISPRLYSKNNRLILQPCLEGRGISSQAEINVVEYIATGKLVRVLDGWRTGRLSLAAVVKSSRFLPEVTKTFINFLQKQAMSLP